MALTYKVLGQVSPAAITNTDLYTTPAATSTVASTLTVCNIGANVSNIRVAVRPAGATLSNEHYIVFNNTVGISDTLFLTIGLSLAATDVVTVYSSNASVTFNLFGSEIQ